MTYKSSILFMLMFFSSKIFADDSILTNEFGKYTNSLKGKIFAQYNRELRSNPKLSGKIIFDLAIRENGSLEECSIYLSELKSATLENKICEVFKSKSYKGFPVKPARFKYTQIFLPY